MKTKEELNALKEEVETLNKKLAELSEEELEQIAAGAIGGKYYFFCKGCGYNTRDYKIGLAGTCPLCDGKIYTGRG